MTVVAEFTIAGEEFLLGRLVGGTPVTVEIERVVPVDGRVMPYLWGYGDGLDGFERAVREARSVRSFVVLERFEHSALYSIEWERPLERFVAGLADADATLLSAIGEDDWTFRIRFDDRSGLVWFHRYCTDRGVDYGFDRVYSLEEPTASGRLADLSDVQYETLRRAVERGWFKVPREVTLADLAEEFGVSEQAISERVRRGADGLLEAVLLSGDERPP